MHSKTIPVILHPNFTKIAAVLLGYTIWLFGSSYQWVSKEYTLPLCFYQNNERIIQAPESVIVKILGPSVYVKILGLSEPARFMPKMGRKFLQTPMDLKYLQLC